MSKKSEVLTKLNEYIAMIKNKFFQKWQTLRSYNGGGYTSIKVENFQKELGLQHQLTVPHCLSEIGDVECKNRTLLKMLKQIYSRNFGVKSWTRLWTFKTASPQNMMNVYHINYGWIIIPTYYISKCLSVNPVYT